VGRLYVVPTPIGNLEDITFRAVRVLREAPLILAEDTRHTRKLLAHYEIPGRMLSYHQHNKLIRVETILTALGEGDVALVSSAGMPAVSDPGFELIRAAVDRGIEVDVLPGPSAVVTAVVAAALPAPGFLFAGFLPRQSSDRRRRLNELAHLPYSLVFYEAPHRLLALLKDAQALLGDRPVVAAREMTKLHQEIVRSTVAEMVERYGREEPRGEFTLVVAGAGAGVEDQTDEILDYLRRRKHEGISGRVAVEDMMVRYGLKRNEAYRLWLESTGDSSANESSRT
jgi:16S rRNA (cytidine1402-2'-O)-methyltransferase